MSVLTTVFELVEKSCMLCCGLMSVFGVVFATVVSLYFKKKFV